MPATTWDVAGEVVPVTTLDRLVERFGVPVYCKIDVEGFEPQVLGGLSRALALLSFEFHAEVPENLRDAVARIAALGEYGFNYSIGEWPGFGGREWLDSEALIDAVAREGDQAWGNVFAAARASAAR